MLDRIIELMQQRRSIRQWCFRMQKAHENNDVEVIKSVELSTPELDLQKQIEAFLYFGGWENFGITWNIPRIDVAELQKDRVPNKKILAMLEAPLCADELMFSLEEQWDAEVRKHARDIPKKKSVFEKNRIAQVLERQRM